MREPRDGMVHYDLRLQVYRLRKADLDLPVLATGWHTEPG